MQTVEIRREGWPQALAQFSAAPDSFHLVLSDMSMPGMSGIDFATSVLKLRPDTLVVIASGYMEPKDMERAKAAGVLSNACTREAADPI